MRRGLLLAWFALSVDPAFPCSCATGPSIAFQEQVTAARDGAAAVFSGRVLSVEPVRQPGSSPNAPFAGYAVSFEVERAWKPRKLPERVEVGTAASGAACGLRFEIGREYLIYARGSVTMDSAETRLGTDQCTRTGLLDAATADFPWLELAPSTMTLAGRVSDGEGGFIAGVQLTLASASLPGGEHTTMADSRGRFRLEGVAPGEYTLTLNLWDQRPADPVSIRLDGISSHLAVQVRRQPMVRVELTVVDREYRR